MKKGNDLVRREHNKKGEEPDTNVFYRRHHKL